MDAASQLVKPAYSASAGRGKPGGGIARTLSLRSTRSQVLAFASRSSKLAALRLTGSSLGEDTRSLWHPTQYLSSIARYLSASAAVGAAAGIPWLTPGACAINAAATHRQTAAVI